MERKILVALLVGWLEKQWNELGRELVPKLKPCFKGESMVVVKGLLLECFEEASSWWVAEQRQKLEESKRSTRVFASEE